MDDERYNLVGIDGNAFSVIGYVTKAMREQKFSSSEITCYRNDAMSSDYMHLLSISIEMIDKCNSRAIDFAN